MIVNYNSKIDKLELFFKYHLDTIEIVKSSFDGRKWDGSTKCWVIPFSEDNLKKLKGLFFNVKFSDKLIEFIRDRKQSNPLTIEKISELKDIKIKDFNFITKPYRFQKIAFEFARRNDYSGLFMDMGLGKTKITIDVIRWRLQEELIDSILIVVPNNLIDTWLEEIGKHSHIERRVIGILNQRQKKDRLKILSNPNKFIFIINYEGLLVLREELRKKKWDMIVCDESTYIKNHKAKRTKELVKFSNRAKYRMILTGTPTGNSVVDLFGQFLFLDRKIFSDNFFAFRNTYCVMGGFKGKVVVATKNLDKLTKYIGKRCIRFNKEDCIDLPPRIFVQRKVEMSDEQYKLATQVIDESIVMVENNIITTTREATKRSIKLAQINGGFIRDDDGEDWIIGTSPKIKELLRIIEESGSTRIIVWTMFVTETEIITKELNKVYGKDSAFFINGRVSNNERKIIFKHFKDSDTSNKKFLVMTVDVAAFGLNLQVADLMIYYSRSYRYLLRKQSLDRNYRPGQEAKKVTVVDILVKNSIDEMILKTLNRGKNLQDSISDPLDFFKNLRRKLNGKEEKKS